MATGGYVTATGTVTGGNISTGGYVTATGDVTGGNLYTGGTASVTGNVTGGNISTTGQVSASGNITSGAGSYFIGDGSQLTGVTASSVDAGNLTGNTLSSNVLYSSLTSVGTLSSLSVTGDVTGGNLYTGGAVSATGTVTGGNVSTAGYVTATGSITGGNLYTSGSGGDISGSGNITGGNILTGGILSATGNVSGGNITVTGQASLGNIVISGDDITDTNGRVNFNTALGAVDFAVNGQTANVFYISATDGTASFGSATQTTDAIVAFNATDSILIPTGNIGQRPVTGVTGMLRFNTTNNTVEVYNNSEWQSVGATVFTVIADEQFYGDGSTVNFTLASTQTTQSCIVAINGVVQIPTTAYSVSGTYPTCVLTFTEAPEIGDVIDVREITTTTTVTSISNASGNAVVAVSPTASTVNVTGDLSVSGSILGGNINSTAISYGTSNMTVVTSGGNIRGNVAGATVMTISPGLMSITGDLSVSGNATLSGNILGDRIVNGTTEFDIQVPGGNANITIGGVANTAVFSTTALTLATNLLPSANITYDLGSTTQRWKDLWLSNSTIYLGNAQISANATSLIFTNPAGGQTVLAGATASITGATVSASGNITGGNLATGGTASATGNITGGNILTVGLVSATGNITGSYIIGNGSQLTGLPAGYSNTNAASFLAAFGSNTISTSGTITAGNITGSNLLTGGLISSTGNITGGNLSGTNISGTLTTASQTNITSVGTLGALSVTGNITGGNLSGTNISGTLTTASQTNITSVGTLGALSVTGNITGGNISATNYTGTNVSVSGTVTAASTVGGVITGSSASVSGNITGGNLNTTGTAIIGGFTISGNTLITSGTTFTIDPNGSGGLDGLVVINGNLQVNGNTTTINSNVVSTNDLTVNYANNAINSAAANGGGIEIGPIGSPFITWLYNNTANVFTSSGGISAVGGVTAASVAGGVITGSSASVTGAVTAASTVGGIITGSSISVSGNISAGGNITNSTTMSTNTVSAVTVSASGNITSGNISATNHTGTNVSVTGTVTAASTVGGVITGSSASVTGTVTAASTVGGVITGSSASVSGTVTGGNVTTAGQLTVNSGGNVTAIVNGGTNGVGNIGASGAGFNTVFAKATTAQYADLAEKYVADAEYAPGTVLVFGGTAEVTVNAEDADRRVAGVVSTDPGFLMNEGLDTEFTAAIALTGRVPTFVVGPVRKGDLMVAAGLGRARAETNPQVGSVIGKALEDFDGAEGTIEVVVGRF